MEEDREGTETTQSEGLERREEVSGQEGCRAESSEKSIGREAGSGWTAATGNSGWRRRRRTGESICYNVLGARQVDEVAGELQEKGQLPLLSC